jgi:hypothetical protein
MRFTKRVTKRLLERAQLAFAFIVFCFFVSATDAQSNAPVLLRKLKTLDPLSRSNLIQLDQVANAIADSKAGKLSKSEKKAARSADALKDLPTDQLKKLFSNDSPKHESRIASVIARLADAALRNGNDKTRSEQITNILEIQAALRNEDLPLVPSNLGFFTSWVFFFQNRSGSVARGNTPAANLPSLTAFNDGGRTDPLPSTFWQRPENIPGKNLYAGFGRDRLPRFDDDICTYSAPKVSSGTHAGFDVEYHGARFKIKFGEVNSEPFTARIFHALGYHVDPTDYTPQIKIRYDRRMLRELHLRRPLNMGITPFGVHLWTVHLQQHYDPFTFITTAVFKDGRQIPGALLKQILFKNPNLPHPEDSPENFRPEIEASLDYLVMNEANVQPRDGPTESIGSWDFGQLGHQNLRELRGAGLLAGWLAWFDSRADNTKLRLVRNTDDVKIEHFISDLGGGMGEGNGWFSPHGENPNHFAWTFTEPEIVRGPGRMTTPFRITHFRPIVPTPAFDAMTPDDARWMARLIAQLTEQQLRTALVASGYDNAEARLYLEKLISRRDRMIIDLGLQNELPLLHPKPQDRAFSYRPSQDGPFEAAANGVKVVARSSAKIILNGKIPSENSLHP